MQPIVIAAVSIITLALVCYTVATAAHQRSHRITGVVAAFLTIGVAFDVTATLCMVVAAGGIKATLHGALGITALFGMLLETILAWRHRLEYGPEVPVSAGKRLYARIAYCYWVLAFISGGTMVMMSRRAARQAASLLL
jgi:hypothetical protein